MLADDADLRLAKPELVKEPFMMGTPALNRQAAKPAAKVVTVRKLDGGSEIVAQKPQGQTGAMEVWQIWGGLEAALDKANIIEAGTAP